MTPIPVVALGALCAAGADVDTSYSGVVRGVDGLAPLSLFDSGLSTPPPVAQVDTAHLDRLKLRTQLPRTTALALGAVREAMGELTLPRSFRLGVVTATTVAGITRSELFYRNQLTDPTLLRHAATELAEHEPTALTGTIVRECNGLGGYSLSTACSTGVHAIGMAMRLIERGYFDGCVAVGSDALAILTVRGFASLTLLDAQGCRPFDAQRAGISLGEGAGALLLMSPRAAKNLGMTPLAMLSGWGASADCHHMTAPHPDGEGALKAMRMALSAGGVSEQQVDLIISHGTATPDNDAAEIGALRQLFTTPPPFCSMKRTLGHTLAASGVLETVLGIRAMQHNHIPPTAGFTMVDESIGLAPSLARAQRIEVIVKNAFGFGGNNASLLITKGV